MARPGAHRDDAGVAVSRAAFPDRRCRCGATIRVWDNYLEHLRVCELHGLGPNPSWAIESVAAINYECPKRRWWNHWKHDRGRADRLPEQAQMRLPNPPLIGGVLRAAS